MFFTAEMITPVWLVDRTDIPQPGSYAHFHWLDAAEEPSGLRRGICYRGYFLELQAIESFAFEHGNELIPVRPGIDIATHVNIVASFPGFSSSPRIVHDLPDPGPLNGGRKIPRGISFTPAKKIEPEGDPAGRPYVFLEYWAVIRHPCGTHKFRPSPSI